MGHTALDCPYEIELYRLRITLSSEASNRLSTREKVAPVRGETELTHLLTHPSATGEDRGSSDINRSYMIAALVQIITTIDSGLGWILWLFGIQLDSALFRGELPRLVRIRWSVRILFQFGHALLEHFVVLFRIGCGDSHVS